MSWHELGRHTSESWDLAGASDVQARQWTSRTRVATAGSEEHRDRAGDHELRPC
jgi:hypothetical protein